MEQQTPYKHKFLPYLLVAPQLLITLVFFYLACNGSTDAEFYGREHIWYCQQVCVV